MCGKKYDEHESSKFCLSVLNALKRRGVQDVYLFCAGSSLKKLQIPFVKGESSLRLGDEAR